MSIMTLCSPVGGAARHSTGDFSAAEPAAARGEQRSQRENSQLREVAMFTEPSCWEIHVHTIQTAANDCVACCRRLEDTKGENKEMSQALSSKETSIQYIQQQLEEKNRECSVLSRQLQQTLDDAQRQVWNDTVISFCCPSVSILILYFCAACIFPLQLKPAIRLQIQILQMCCSLQ